MRRHKRHFKDKLAQPLYRRPRLDRFEGIVFRSNRDGMSAPVLEALVTTRTIHAHADERLSLLLDLYGIPADSDDKWRDLALALAQDYVPGFRVENSPGARKKWGRRELMRLYSKVGELMATGMSAMEACRILAVAPDTEQGFPLCKSFETLRRRYHEAKRSLK